MDAGTTFASTATAGTATATLSALTAPAVLTALTVVSASPGFAGFVGFSALTAFSALPVALASGLGKLFEAGADAAFAADFSSGFGTDLVADFAGGAVLGTALIWVLETALPTGLAVNFLGGGLATVNGVAAAFRAGSFLDLFEGTGAFATGLVLAAALALAFGFEAILLSLDRTTALVAADALSGLALLAAGLPAFFTVTVAGLLAFDLAITLAAGLTATLALTLAIAFAAGLVAAGGLPGVLGCSLDATTDFLIGLGAALAAGFNFFVCAFTAYLL